MEQLLIDFSLTSDLNIKPNRIPDILTKCLEIYNESLNYKNKEYYSDSMYNMILALNILNYLKKSNLIDLNSQIKPFFDSTCLKIVNSINSLKEEVNTIYFNQVGHLITKNIRNQIDKIIIKPLLFNNLYKSNFKGILFSGSDINNRQYIIQYIMDEVSKLNNTVIIHYNYKINLKNNQNYQNIIVLIDDIKKCDPGSILKLKKINESKINLYIISTASDNQELSPEQKELFEYKINIPHPNTRDIENYLRYRIFQHLDFENLFEKKYKIDILNDDNMKCISKKMYEFKYDYYDINSVINGVLDISSMACIKQNIFKVVSNNKSLISMSSLYAEDKSEQIYLYNKPKYKEIIFDNHNYINSNYCPNIHFSFEDRTVKEIYIKESDINKKKGDIEIISLIELDISNEELDTSFDCDYHISYIILNLFIFYLTQIINNKNKINRDSAKSPRLISFIELILKEEFTIININDFNNIKKEKLSILFSAFDKLIFQEDPEFLSVFHKCFIDYYKTFFIDFGEIDIELSFDYKGELRKLIISKNKDNSNEISRIIQNLTGSRIKTEIIKQQNKYLVSIESLDEKDISELYVYESGSRLDSCPSIIIDTNIFNLDCAYSITNENDIDLLVEKFPKDYAGIYKEDEETWKYTKIKNQEQIDYLNEQYSHRSKFYLFIFNILSLFLKKKTSMLNSHEIDRAQALNFDIQMILDAILDITEEFDKKIWQSAWNISSTEEEEFGGEPSNDNDDNEQYEFNYNDNIVYLHKKFYIDIFFLKRLVSVLNIKKCSKLEDYYNSHNHKIYINQHIEEILVRSNLNLKSNQDNVYTNLHIQKIPFVKHKKELMGNIIHKILTKKYLYFDIFQNIIDITSKKDNIIKTYSINSDNYLVPLQKIALNIIRNENNMSLFKLTDGILPPIINKWMTAYACSCICSHQDNFDYTKLFVSILLYDGYICNFKKKTIFDIINDEDHTESIINKINYIYKIKNVSYKKRNSKIFENRKTNLTFKFPNTNEFNENNSAISKLLRTPVNNLNNLIKTYNIKKEYFDDCIFEKHNNI